MTDMPAPARRFPLAWLLLVVAIVAGVAFGNTLAKPITDRMGTLLPTELVMHQRG